MKRMSLLTKLRKIRDALNVLDADVGHYEHKGNKKKYIVWSEDGEGDSLHTDNEKDIQVLSGTVDLFTRDEYDPLIDAVQETFEKNGISYKLISVQYEEETKYIHYEWRVEVS